MDDERKMKKHSTSGISTRSLYVLLFFVVIAWGFGWPASKVGLTYISPYWYAVFRQVLGNLILFFVVIGKKKLVVPSGKDWLLVVSLGLFQVGLFILFICLGLMNAESGNAAMLVYTTPLWVMPVAIFFFKEPNHLRKWIGFLLGIGGVLILLNPEEINWALPGTMISVLFLLGASLSLAISILCARYLTWHREPLELIVWQLLLGSILLIIIALVFDPHPKIELNLVSILSVLYTGIFASAFGFLGMTVLSKELPATVTSIGFLGVPVSGVFFAVLLFHEPFDGYKLIAMVCILLGVYCVVKPLGRKMVNTP